LKIAAMKYFLGVDGGGTSTRAVVADASGQIIGQGSAGESNFLYAGIEGTSLALANAVSAALAWRGLAISEVTAAFFGMAGVVSEADRDAVRTSIGTLGLLDRVPVGVDHDIRIALTGGLGGSEGIALIAGTGSACFGRNAGGKSWRCGGWGSLVDDVGGAHWVVVEALKAAVRQCDGRLPATALLPTMFEALGIRQADEFIQRVYGPAASRSEIAALCPVVMRLWQDGDPIAVAIFNEGVHRLAEMVEVTGRTLGLSSPEIVVSGGLWEAEMRFRDALAAAVHQLVPEANIRQSMMTPVMGAIIEARRLVESSDEAPFIATMAHTGQFMRDMPKQLGSENINR
jgi:glucosamine kinase